MLNKIKEKTLDQLAKLFVEASISHGQGTLTGDYQKCNKAYSLIQIVYDELKRRDLVENVLFNLLINEDISVRIWAASYLLQSVPEESMKVLKEISSTYTGILSSNAELVLEEWKKGDLKF